MERIDSVNITKEKIRREVLKKRLLLSPEDIREASQKIIEKLENLKEFQKAQIVMLYYPIKGEVDIRGLFKKVMKEKILVLPKMVGEEILPIEVKDLEVIRIGKFGIVPEPVGGRIIKPQKIDLIVVPGLAFDKRKYRIGFGKGYYDRFLKKTKGIKVGVAYDFQIFEKLPSEAHDQPVDLVITPSRLF